jgi:hypothetical protein
LGFGCSTTIGFAGVRTTGSATGAALGASAAGWATAGGAAAAPVAGAPPASTARRLGGAVAGFVAIAAAGDVIGSARFVLVVRTIVVFVVVTTTRARVALRDRDGPAAATARRRDGHAVVCLVVRRLTVARRGRRRRLAAPARRRHVFVVAQTAETGERRGRTLPRAPDEPVEGDDDARDELREQPLGRNHQAHDRAEQHDQDATRAAEARFEPRRDDAAEDAAGAVRRGGRAAGVAVAAGEQDRQHRGEHHGAERLDRRPRHRLADEHPDRAGEQHRERHPSGEAERAGEAVREVVADRAAEVGHAAGGDRAVEVGEAERRQAQHREQREAGQRQRHHLARPLRQRPAAACARGPLLLRRLHGVVLAHVVALSRHSCTAAATIRVAAASLPPRGNASSRPSA